ncbi:2-oxo acid dehydrogenase subunit E2 [Micromonospora sp. DT43]|uniref:2-oxo acid dehydrogenase subunit E2 n=1 Tax=Micromonospora sp. DT43 TaxID=3393440 RepID=UPI003CF6DEA5
MPDVRLPKLNNNDVHYVLVEWAVPDGGLVRAGDPVAVVETSKATEEIVAEHTGVLRHMAREGSECAVGAPIGVVSADGEAPAPEPEAAPAQGREEVLITEPAERLAAELGIPRERLLALGRKVIRRTDVTALAAATDDVGHVDLPRGQPAIARAVAASHADVPAAFVAVRVVVDDAVRRARDAGRAARQLIGLPELTVRALGRLRTPFPVFFGTRLADGTVTARPGAHVGVTVDVGNGLVVPVVRDADRLDLTGIAQRLLAVRLAAMRDGVQERDLAGANIMLALANEPGVVLSRPIVFPGQVCAVALPGTLSEAVPGSEPGSVAFRTVVDIGLAYDHRVVNGRDAVLFLQALKAQLESDDA